MSIAPFVQNLWNVVNDDSVSGLISWTEDRSGIVVHDIDKFVSEVMPRVVRSPSFCAFVRQLNGYGFSKSDPARAAFRHTGNLFLPDRPDLLQYVKRKRPAQTKREAPAVRAQREEMNAEPHYEEDGGEMAPEDDTGGAPSHFSVNDPVTVEFLPIDPVPVTVPTVDSSKQRTSENFVAPSLEEFAKQFGLTYATVPKQQTAPKPEVKERSASTDKTQSAVYKELILDALSTLDEIRAANKPELWADGTAGRLIDMAIANLLRNQAAAFPALDHVLRNMPSKTHADVIAKGLPTLTTEISSDSASVVASTRGASEGVPCTPTAVSNGDDMTNRPASTFSHLSACVPGAMTAHDAAAPCLMTLDSMLASLPELKESEGKRYENLDEDVAKSMLLAETVGNASL